MSSEAARRAARRRSWPGTVTTLSEQEDAMLVRHGTAADRILMLWRVTQDAWVSSGRELPTYDRAGIPGHIQRA